MSQLPSNQVSRLFMRRTIRFHLHQLRIHKHRYVRLKFLPFVIRVFQIIYLSILMSVKFLLNLAGVRFLVIRVDSGVFGHLSSDLDPLYQELRFHSVWNKGYRIFFVPDSKVVNIPLFDLWVSAFAATVLPYWILGPTEPLNTAALGFSHHRVHLPLWKNRVLVGANQDPKGVLKLSNQVLLTSSHDLDSVTSELLLLGVEPKDKVALLIVRDSAYYRESWPEYEQVASARNDDIGVFNEAIDFLVEQGIKVFRMGAKVEKPFGFTHPNVFDYATNGMRNELRDIYLFRRAAIVISNNTGGDHLAHTFRKPLVHACEPNYLDLNATRNIDRLFFSLKPAYDTSTGERLTLSTVLGRLHELDEIDYFAGISQCGVELRSNSPREIRSLVEEAVAATVCRGQKEETRWTEGQREFWRNYDLIRDCVFGDASARARIGSNFYQSNYLWLV